MKKKKLLTLIGSVCLILVLAALPFLAACPAPPPAEEEKPAPTPISEPKVLKAVSSLPIDYKAFACMQYYCDAVKLYSGGRLTIDLIGSSDVIPAREQPVALRKGTIDVVFGPGFRFGTLHPIGEAMNLPELTTWEARERGVYDFYNKHFALVNIRYLGDTFGPQWELCTASIPAKTPAELKGLKAYGGGRFFAAAIEALGMTPVELPTGDIYTALERGVIDVSFFPPCGWLDWGWADVVDYVVGPRYIEGYLGYGPAINLDVWNSLSKEEQNWLEQPFIDNAEVWWGYNYWTFSGPVYGEEAMKAAGIQFIEWSPSDTEWAKQTFRDAAWEFVSSILEPDVARDYAELTGLPQP